MQEIIQALRHVLFLKTLPEDALAKLAQAGVVRHLNTGEMLVAERERNVSLIVVLRGAVKIYKMDDRGRELTLGLEIAGDSVMELPLFDGGNYPASAEAVEADTAVLMVPRDKFRALMTVHPEIGGQALRTLGVRMRALMQKLEAQTLHTVERRLARYLLETADSRTVFRLEETNEAIGSHLGTVREVVSRTLRRLRDADVITMRGRVVTIADRQSLTSLAGHEENEED